jgi:hypothetical protein
MSHSLTTDEKELLRSLAAEGRIKTKGIRPSALRLEAAGLAKLNKSNTTALITPAGDYAAKQLDDQA